MIRLLVADGNDTMRLGIRSVLSKSFANIEIDEVTNHAQLLMHLGSWTYDAVLINPSLAEDTSRSIIEQILDIAPEANVLVFSSLDHLAPGVSAIRAGAKAYLTRACSINELTTAIDRVSRGKVHISHELAVEIVTNGNRSRSSSLHAQLSERELQVFAMQVCGVSVTDVARGLNLSAKTVSTHKARAMVKLGINTFTEMVQYAMAQGILDDCRAKCASLLPNRTGDLTASPI